MKPIFFLAALCFVSEITLAEGFYNAKIEAIDDSEWPQVNMLLKVYDESIEPEQFSDALERPTPYDCQAGLEKRGWSCWSIDLQENGRHVTDVHQVSVATRPGDNWSYLWLSYHSTLASIDEGLLTLNLEIPEWSLRSANSQQPLQLYSAKTPALSGSPWKFMLQRSDQQLNTNYQHLQENLSEPEQTLLRKAQRAWLQLRGARCPAQLKSRQTRCLYMTTQDRAEELQQLRQQL
ncbi:hypothetical protein A9179_18035 [Pseudomonas alcaligenes]|uniref:Lysozyme inhibitor LprI-like N-terminal domain-containing protein n=1 Tax=Aquipseudomonas alcaligenes TaxID=43263 RepID=A0ABR7S3N7_AQUAC|nr:lysozyme inhibitor LprI family protein [Pseudomonas alcaligenes]MBC9252176.1 hypothetical protein [Pseudomonas alcaligenes]